MYFSIFEDLIVLWRNFQWRMNLASRGKHLATLIFLCLYLCNSYYYYIISNLLHNGTKTFLKSWKIESYSYYKVHIAFLKIFPFLYLNNKYVVFWISMLIITYFSSLVRLWNFNAVHAESKVETAKGNICNFKSWIFNFSAEFIADTV